jgi:DNA invertase Pin-like site-specific DNA recombinase
VTTPRLRASPLLTGHCLGYVRVSKEDQAAEHKTSLSDQRAAIAALAGRLGRHLSPPLIFEDPGVSGATAEDRPGFMALVRYCEAHPRPRSAPGYVLALNDSRWGRFPNPEESTYWRVHLDRHGWRVRFAEGDETEDPTARIFLRAVHSTQATAYLEAIRANAKRGAQGAARRGLWQNEAPLGYRRRARDPVTGQERTLEPGQLKGKNEEVRLTVGPPEERQIVQTMFARYAGGGVSLGALARELDRTFPGRAWSKQTVRAFLKNPAYLGDVVWCRRPHDKAERRERWIRPEADWIVTRDAHPALVSREMFAAVQQRLATNRRQTRATAGGYPLSGLLRCAQCGEPYTGGGGPHGPPQDPDRYRFYKDRGGVGRVPACSGPLGTLQKRWIEPRIIATVTDVVSRPDVRRLIAEECDRQLSDLRSVHTGGRAALERERTRLDTERERLVAAIAHGTVTEAEAAVQLAGNRTALDRIAADLERLRFEDRRSTRLDGERAQLVALAADFATVARRASGAQLRELLRPWIADAVVDKANRKLTLTIRRVPLAGAFLQLRAAPGRGSP